MKVVFLIGPYRSTTEHGVYENIHRAGQAALDVWQCGAACLSPQKNTAFFGGAAEDQVWLDGAVAMLMRCDVALAMPGWQGSSGSQNEVARAKEAGIPVMFSVDELKSWLESPKP